MRLTPNVLYVEDDADTRELISIVLQMANYQVVLAEDYDEALLLARVMRFDLYIMDNWMPGGSGIELCKTLRVFDATTPIIFYSGAAYDSDKREAFAAGAQAYLTKPADNDTLIDMIARVIAAAPKIEVPGRTVTLDAVGYKQLTAFGELLLPTAAQRTVELDQRKQFVASGLRQAQLGTE